MPAGLLPSHFRPDPEITHDANFLTRSWVASANGHADFPLQNLPLGVFSVKGSAPRSGVAIGEHIFDLQAALDADLFDGAAKPRSKPPVAVN